jgi:hypothetical protein
MVRIQKMVHLQSGGTRGHTCHVSQVITALLWQDRLVT